jgi:hypothetical protein
MAVQQSPLRLALIDPALGNIGAHNAGFASLLANNPPPGAEIAVWCHQPEEETCVSPQDNGLEMHPLFSVHFYELFRRPGNVASHWRWISTLAGEYTRALAGILERWPRGPVAVIYHTLSWEHASALALAIEDLGIRGDRLRHFAFLMYSPGAAPSGRTLHAKRRINFRLAFGALARHSNVKLYASCSEYAKAYAHVLEKPEPLPLHPCFLGDWRTAPQKRFGGKGKHTILYLGEVKEDKGFDKLPKLVEQSLAKAAPKDRFTIQFIRTQSNVPERQAVIDKITALGRVHSQLKVHAGFWSDEELNRALLAADQLYLPYNADAYRHKSSGLLWLAAWYGLKAVVPQDSWLEREAKRLGVRYALLDKSINVVAERPDTPGPTNYYHEIFTPFWAWLGTEWQRRQ